ncbi:MAG: mycothiol-dependent nitroreductase Rv2466c family protein [Acidimicrobiales bacterium]
MSDVEFFFDPICPWAWLTSRWVAEVAARRDLDVDWRFICLGIVNASRSLDPSHEASYLAGRRLLRVAAAVRAAEGRERVGELYTQFGGDLHVHRRRDDIVGDLPGYLVSVGLGDYVGAAGDEGLDTVLQEETDAALERTGRDVGTPIITFGGASWFGPVISRVPRGDEALRLWDAVWEVATFPGLAELKRSLREPPQLEDSLG